MLDNFYMQGGRRKHVEHNILGYQGVQQPILFTKKKEEDCYRLVVFNRSFPPKDEVYLSFQENASSYLGAFQIPSYPYP